MDHKNDLDSAFTSRYWEWCYLTAAELPATLGAAVQKHLTHIDPCSWAERLALGGIYINGHPALSLEATLPLPCRIEYYEPSFELRQAEDFFPKFSPSQIVFEDLDLLVAYKPPGLPTMPARDQARFSLKHQLDKHLGRTIHMPSRLDMSAQGLVIVSTSERMHGPLQQCFEHRRVRKTYILRTARQPSWQDCVNEGAIGKDPAHPVLRCVGGHQARSARTTFRTLLSDAQGSIVAAYPETGRTHQIRVHAKDFGIPLLGDKFYGDTPAPELCLACFRLEMQHPFTEDSLVLTLPQQFCPSWLPYNEVLPRL